MIHDKVHHLDYTLFRLVIFDPRLISRYTDYITSTCVLMSERSIRIAFSDLQPITEKPIISMLGLPHLVGVTDTVRSAEEPHANAVNEINKIQQSQIAM